MKQLSAMITGLLAGGMSEMSIAQHIGVSQPTVHRIKHGSSTSYDVGKSIERLYLDASVASDDPTLLPVQALRDVG